MRHHYALCTMLGMLMEITLGCREHLEAPRLACNVTGVVTINDTPTSGIYVYLSPIAEGQAATLGAKTDEHGVFSISVATPGDYLVTTKWPKVTLDHGEEIEGEDRFQGKYAMPKKPVLQVAIHEGDNTIPPINLKR